MALSSIEISSASLRSNLSCFRALVGPNTKCSVVVKANAYGHGLVEVVESLEGLVDYFQIDDADELERIRRVTQAPVLLLGFVAKSDMETVVQLGAECAVISLEHIADFGEVSQKLHKDISIHLAVDSLLGREGVLENQVQQALTLIGQYPLLKLVGMYSHFSNIEDTSDPTHAQHQIEAFKRTVGLCFEFGYRDILTHISATSGILAYEREYMHNSLVRLGIGVYGIWPSEDLRSRDESVVGALQPVLRWVTHVAQVKQLPTGYPIGYGLTYITPHPMKVALIPQGYSDGYSRSFSNTKMVLIQGKRCSVLGRVAMNMCVVDVSHLAEIKPEEEVVLLGKQGGDEITAEELAEDATINYEILARISPLLPRKLV